MHAKLKHDRKQSPTLSSVALAFLNSQNPNAEGREFHWNIATLLHDYSLGNIIDAWMQCEARGIPFGRIATFKKWQELGRLVRKGEKALWLTVPRLAKKEKENGEEEAFTFFMYLPKFFVEAQTEGAPVPPRTLGNFTLDELSRKIDAELASDPITAQTVAVRALVKKSVGIPMREYGHQARFFFQHEDEKTARETLKRTDEVLRAILNVPKKQHQRQEEQESA